MTEDRHKWRKYVHGVANPLTAKEQNIFDIERCKRREDRIYTMQFLSQRLTGLCNIHALIEVKIPNSKHKSTMGMM